MINNVIYIDIPNCTDKIAYFPKSMRFFKVNEEGIKLINKVINNFNNDEIINSKYINLIKECLSINTPFKLNEIDTNKINEDITKKSLYKLVIHLANSCNLRCIYCYANGGTYHSNTALITKDTIDKIIEVFYNEFNSIKNIQFFGGEPLLNMDILEYCCEKFREKDENINFGIVTNGTLINERYIELVKKYKISNTISYDGTFDVNNILRKDVKGKGVSQLILEKAKYLQKETNMLHTIESTYTQIHLDNNVSILDVIKHISQELPNVPIHLAPAVGDENSKFALKTFEPFVNSVTDIFKENNKSNTKYSYSLIDRIIFNILNKDKSKYICGAGDSSLSVSVKGDIYPCFMFTDLEEYYLGNIYDNNPLNNNICNSILQKIEEFSNKEKNKKCKNCFINNICSSCLGFNILSGKKSIYEIDNRFCNMFRNMTKQVLIELTKLNEERK